MKTIEDIMGLVDLFNDSSRLNGSYLYNDKTMKARKEIESALRELVERQKQDKVDAECFRWWVHEAEANPVLVAKAISHCVTEDEYRLVICGAMQDAKAAIKMAQKG